MKQFRRLILILAAALLLAGAAMAEEAAYAPGLSRVAGGRGFEQATALAGRLGVELVDGAPLYAPARPQPLNAYMVTDPDCQLGIDGDDMYAVDDKGLIPAITDYLTAWMGQIEDASGGLIRFVEDPDDADVLVSARQSFQRYGTYSGDGLSAEGYSCTVTLKAWRLSDPASAAGFSETRKPEDTVRLRRDGGGSFWMTPPEPAGTEKLAGFTEAILGWYGFGAGEGTRGAGVKALQQALIDRGFLADRADGDFGPKTGAAVMRLQEAYGLPMTGLVDGRTLLAAYYDAETVAALP